MSWRGVSNGDKRVKTRRGISHTDNEIEELLPPDCESTGSLMLRYQFDLELVWTCRRGGVFDDDFVQK